MTKRIQHKIRPSQIAVIIGATLALYLVMAFASKAVEAHRLRRWQDELEGEIASMERERDDLVQELDRRQSVAWLDERLREAGMVPSGVVSVIAVPVADEQPATGAEVAADSIGDEPVERTAFFDNPRWEAWLRLIFGFDDAG